MARALFLIVQVLVFACGCLLSVGCGRLVAPGDQARVEIALSVSAESGRLGDKIVARASVRNVGSTPVLRPVGCTGGGPYLELLDPDGKKVCPVRYCDILPSCPSYEDEWEHGVLETALEFDGVLWVGGEAFRAPSGEYTVSALFVYRTPGGPQVIERAEVVFFWDGQ